MAIVGALREGNVDLRTLLGHTRVMVQTHKAIWGDRRGV
jgi:hypothetical protein